MGKKIIEADVEVVSSEKRRKAAKNQQKTTSPNDGNPFAAFGAGGAGMNGMPDISALFGENGMPDLSKMPGIPLKQRLIFKCMSLAASPKLRFLKSKWSMPLWGIIAIIGLALVLVLGVLFLLFRLIKALLAPYVDIFKKKPR